MAAPFTLKGPANRASDVACRDLVSFLLVPQSGRVVPPLDLRLSSDAGGSGSAAGGGTQDSRPPPPLGGDAPSEAPALDTRQSFSYTNCGVLTFASSTRT